MKRDQVQKAAEAEIRLQVIDRAIERAGSNNLKVAFLLVQGTAHGMMGPDNRPQQDETRISFERNMLLWVLEQLRKDELKNLEALGVDL